MSLYVEREVIITPSSWSGSCSVAVNTEDTSKPTQARNQTVLGQIAMATQSLSAKLSTIESIVFAF